VTAEPSRLEEVEGARRAWHGDVLRPALDRFGLDEPPDRFYGPDDVGSFDFLRDVGFPGQYPFTAGTYPSDPSAAGGRGTGAIPQAAGLVRAGRYSGYGGPEDTAAYYTAMIAQGQRAGPNLAFDLPTQCGYDSDAPLARGEVGRTGVAIDSMDDFRTLYAPFVGPMELDRVASNWTINAPAIVIVAMYALLAEERGLDATRLRATPQNDVLKEFIARGTYIFPPRPSMRLVRDIFLFATEHLPAMNLVSAGGYHMREAGATREQDLGFSMANAIAYLETGIAAGIDVDVLAPRISFNAFGGSLELFKEVAFQRAARRMWARIVREGFGARNPRSWLLRQPSGAHMGYYNATIARPLNNLTRAVVGGVASALSGYSPVCEPPFDEALGLGWSHEGMQLSEDAARILTYEARLTEVRDPLAGSYYVESLTDEIEAAAQAVVDDIAARGGAVAAVESGYMPDAVARSAVQRALALEDGTRVVVGLNAFTGSDEHTVEVQHASRHPYDLERMAAAEAHQLAKLEVLRGRRSTGAVVEALDRLRTAAEDDAMPLVPAVIASLRVDATLGEICDALRDVFGEHTSTTGMVS
jgi:methylmalonyl-CoA mutase N-terminal domain/subunit